MRKIVILLVSLLAAVSAAAFTPLTSWPYEYEEFIPGRITTYQGKAIEYDRLNINLISGKAHYVQDGVIMEADPNTVALLVIGRDSYVCVGGKMMKVLRNAPKGGVVLSRTVDMEAMNKNDIGYGKSAVASTRGLSASALDAGMEYSVNRSMEDMSKGKDSGERLALKEIKGLCYKGMFIPASRADVLGIPGVDKAAVKKFLKDEKIKFRDTDDLVKLVGFLYSLQ